MLTFRGRGTRKEFIVVNAFSLAIIIGVFLCKSFASTKTETLIMMILAVVGIVYAYLGIIFESMRRLRDVNINPWFALLRLIPYSGIPFTLCLAITPGTDGANRYGENPRDNTIDVKDQRAH